MIIKPFKEKSFNEILHEVSSPQYRIFNPDDPFVKQVCPSLQGVPFVGVCMATGASGDNAIQYEGLTIPPRSPIIVQRIFRYCEHDGHPHYNADDSVCFPVQNGSIMKLSRKDAPDHYVQIVGHSGLEHVANAYHLPVDKEGPITKYVENGALLPIKIEYPENEEKIKMENIRKE